jgi:murein DD-endopeptidase MepM/ murein hydrolase activator NlpD
MNAERAARVRDLIDSVFPERHLYVRSHGVVRGWVLTPRMQIGAAAVAAVAALWVLIATGAMILDAITVSASERQVALIQAKSERHIAELKARHDSALAHLQETAGSIDELAATVERRHAALATVLSEFRDVPSARAALAPVRPAAEGRPLERMLAVRMDQERLVAKAEALAQTRAERLRLAFRLAGLNPASYVSGSGLGGPLVDARDPRALGVVLDVDEAFAARIQRAVGDLDDMRRLQNAANVVPFARPVRGARQSSGYGVRFDPFTGRPALHTGLDFTGPYLTPIEATAPGVVSFAGVRSGYGNTVEIDHGRGLKTRYAHLQTTAVSTGQRVAVGQRIGAMGSTGRSTGVHLHYEIWVNGRPQNPARFIRAAEYVQ